MLLADEKLVVQLPKEGMTETAGNHWGSGFNVCYFCSFDEFWLCLFASN